MGLTAAALLVSQYLAGFLLLASLKLDVRTAGPLTVTRYAYYYGDSAKLRRRLWLTSAAGLVVVGLCGAVALAPRRRSLHGDSAFARGGEIARGGLFAPEGIILGSFGGWGPFGGRLLVLPGQTGVALAAHPGSGKNVGVVTPNLLTWRGSVVCTDPKVENYTITAGFRRAMGQQVYLFHPLSRHRRTTAGILLTTCRNPTNSA